MKRNRKLPTSTGRKGREFASIVRRQLGERVAYMCSNPLCRRLTIKACAVGSTSVRRGKAAHICAASPRGPRFNPKLSDQQCRSFANGIWLCDICAREIDDNLCPYSVDRIRAWKREAEDYVAELVTQDTRLRQLRGMMMPLLSALRILTAIIGPGPNFDQTFRDAGYVPLPRLLIEAEQLLFENGFVHESNRLNAVHESFTQRLIPTILKIPSIQHLDISIWKNRVVEIVMLEIMRYSPASFARYFAVESQMVSGHIKQVAASFAQPGAGVYSDEGLNKAI